MEASQLQDEYKTNEQFHREMCEAQQRYHQNCQLAMYSNLDAIPSKLLCHVGGDDYGHSILLYTGALEPQDCNNLQEKLYLYLVKRFEQLLMANPAIKDKHYSLIFNNTGCPGSMAYFTFKLIFRTMPLNLFVNLKHFIVFNSNMVIRANEWLARGTINKYIKSHTINAWNIKDFVQCGIEPSPQLLSELREGTLSSLPSQLMQDSQKPEDIKRVRFNYTAQGKYSRKESSLDIEKIFYGKQMEHKPKLSELVLYILTQEMSQIKVPVVLETLIIYLSSKPEFLESEGIFRKSPSIEQERKALIHLYEKDYNFIETIKDPHLLCTLIKKILVNLSEPVFSFELYEIIIGHDLREQQHFFFKCIINKMAQVNYNTLLFLLKFFDEKVIPLQQINKMTAHNVAIVLAPCLLRAKSPSMMDIQYAGVLINFVERLLLNFNDVFGDKAIQQCVFATSMQKTEQIVQSRLSCRLTGKQDIKKPIQQNYKSQKKSNELLDLKHQQISCSQSKDAKYTKEVQKRQISIGQSDGI